MTKYLVIAKLVVKGIQITRAIWNTQRENHVATGQLEGIVAEYLKDFEKAKAEIEDADD